jgi:hypothetical protein
MYKYVLLSAIIMSTYSQSKNSYTIGSYSMISGETIQTSQISSKFSNLKQDGLSGPHCSGLYFLVNHSEHLRYGLMTFVANSQYQNNTTYDIQGVGPYLEYKYGNLFYGKSGIQLGAMIIDVLNRNFDSSDSQVEQGTFYKSEDVFIGLTFETGYIFGSYEVGIQLRKMFSGFSDEIKSNKNDVFGTMYLGLNVSYQL